MGDTIRALTETVRGRVITASDPDYDDARAVYNAMHDRRPRAVVRCTDSADVMAVIAAARDSGVDLAIRGGGHSVPGFGTVDDGLVIDLSPMRSVRVDPPKRVARVGGGATLGDVDHATYPFGLAAPGGVVSTTGVAGLTLGGGIGYLTRSVGLSIDNLLSADVVLADGRQVTVSDYQNEDLFWALRGGGGWQIAPPLPFIPGDRVGDLFCVLVTCWNGPHEQAEKVLRPLRDAAEVKAELVGVMPFPALQSAFDDVVPKGMQNYWKADFATELTDEAIAAHVEHGKRTPNVHSSMHLHPINGAAQRVCTDETAFGNRDKSFAPVIVGIWPDPADNEANTKWVRDYYAAIHPHSGSEGGYINFMSGDDGHRAADNYGVNYERLSAVKAVYDPDNLFHVNQNIAPAKGR
jgi:FAD/FMN-containing dehydrogenase